METPANEFCDRWVGRHDMAFAGRDLKPRTHGRGRLEHSDQDRHVVGLDVPHVYFPPEGLCGNVVEVDGQARGRPHDDVRVKGSQKVHSGTHVSIIFVILFDFC